MPQTWDLLKDAHVKELVEFLERDEPKLRARHRVACSQFCKASIKVPSAIRRAVRPKCCSKQALELVG